MRRKLADSVVVITGASSGIGRATARAFARRGATVVLAARREAVLQEVAGECEQVGGTALVVPTDVTDAEAVERLARQTVETFGRIDVWVNNAGVSLFGRFEEVPLEAFRQVIETNLFGYIHGARAAIPFFREQGQGVLINNGSQVSILSQPHTSAYVLSKHAIRALGESLRQELEDAPGIAVCTLLPAAIDTPMFQHAANYTGRAVRPMPPVVDAVRVAERIVRLARHPVREAFVGEVGRLAAKQHTLAPALNERLMARQVEKTHFQEHSSPHTAGNLFEPMAGWSSVDGGWKRPSRLAGRSPLPLVGLALLALPALASWRRTTRH